MKTVEDYIEELNADALNFAKKSDHPLAKQQNEEWHSYNEEIRDKITNLFYSKIFDKKERDHISLWLLDLYTMEELQHSHIETGEIVIGSIYSQWAREAMFYLIQKIETIWKGFHPTSR